MGKKNRQRKGSQTAPVPVPARAIRERKEAKARVQPRSAPATLPLYFSLLTALPTLIYLFLPWYERGSEILRGFDLIRRYDTLPQLMKDAFDLLGGEFFGYILYLLPLLSLALAFLYPPYLSRYPRVFRGVAMVLSYGNFWAGLVLMLSLLHQERIAYITFGGYAMFLLLFATAGFQFLSLYVLDRAEGVREEEALPAWQWATLISAILLATLVHYFWVCYQLIEPAPKALLEELRGKFRL